MFIFRTSPPCKGNATIFADVPMNVFGPRGIPDSFHFFRGGPSQISKAVWFYKSLVMKGSMGFSGNSYKIFNPVVVLYPINVVDDFIFINWSSNGGRHYKNALSNISTLIRVWVIRFMNINITCSRLISTARPIYIQVTRKLVSAYIRFRESLECVFIPKNGLAAATGTLYLDRF